MSHVRVSLAVTLAGVCFVAQPATQSPHNLLVLVADDLGPEMLGCYGGPAPATTPVLDGLAASGMRFTRAYATPLCSPTRAALMTGRYGFRTGVTYSLYPRQTGLPLAEQTLPEALTITGTPAALIGKWHLGDEFGDATPNRAGWPHFAGTMYGGLPDYFAWTRVENGSATTTTNYATSQQVDDALAWIGAQTRPWAAVVAFSAPHPPYHAPPAHLHTENLTGLDPRQQPRPFYRATVQALDAEIGRLLAGLGTARASTVVVFLSDNGTPSEVAQPWLGAFRHKASLYEGGVRVPLIVDGPLVTAANRVSDALTSVADLFATALDVRGAGPGEVAPPGAPADGQSLLPVLRGQRAAIRPSTYSEITRAGLGDGWAIVNGVHKFIRFTGGGATPHDEMYDLAADPTEQNDLLAQPTTPATEALAEQFAAEIFALRGLGSVVRYGTGCGGALGVPRLSCWGVPALGTSLYYRTDPLGVGLAYSVTVLGGSRTSFGGVPLPVDLTWLGMPGCALHTSLDVVAQIATVGTPGRLPIANDRSLVRTRLHLQSFVTDPGANARGLAVSYPLTLLIGE